MSDKCSTCSMNGSCDSGECPPRLPPGMLSEYDLNRSVADGIAVWLEVSQENIQRTSLEAVSKARELRLGRVFGILFGDGEKRSLYGEAFEHGVDSLYHIRSPKLNEFDADAYGNSIKKVADNTFCALLFIPHTDSGTLLSEVLSKKFGMAITSFGMEHDDGPFPKMMFVEQGEFKAISEKGRKGTVFNIIPEQI